VAGALARSFSKCLLEASLELELEPSAWNSALKVCCFHLFCSPFGSQFAGDPLQSPFKIGSSRFFTSIRRNMKLKNPDLFFFRA
jgi:hypothetical protein